MKLVNGAEAHQHHHHSYTTCPCPLPVLLGAVGTALHLPMSASCPPHLLPTRSLSPTPPHPRVASACLPCAVVRATEPGRRHLSPAPLALLLHDASAHIP